MMMKMYNTCNLEFVGISFSNDPTSALLQQFSDFLVSRAIYTPKNDCGGSKSFFMSWEAIKSFCLCLRDPQGVCLLLREPQSFFLCLRVTGLLFMSRAATRLLFMAQGATALLDMSQEPQGFVYVSGSHIYSRSTHLRNAAL